MTKETSTININKSTIGLWSLVGVSVSSMVATGIFSITKDMAEVASIYAIIIGWIITGIGILSIAFTINTLSSKGKHSGMLDYIQNGLGDFYGFSITLGYWVSALLGNISFFILLSSALSVFVPAFSGDSMNIYAFILSSIIMWAVAFILISGIREAARFNKFITIVKILPIIFFILVMAYYFKFHIIVESFNLGKGDLSLGSITEQVKGIMLITLWAFIGIESASLLSGRSASSSVSGKATVISVISVLCLLVMVTILPYGVLGLDCLKNLESPAMAYILESTIGGIGLSLISVTIIIAILGAMLSWVLVTAEILYEAGKRYKGFKLLSISNKKDSPISAILITTAVQQIILLITYLNEATFVNAYTIAASMILVPYLAVSLYGFICMKRGSAKFTFMQIITMLLAFMYCIWLIYSSGVYYMYISSIFYVLILLTYMLNAIKLKQKLLLNHYIVFIVILIMASFALYGFID